MSWEVQNAKAQFSKLLDITLKDGPQVITTRGIEVAMLVPIEEWHRLQSSVRRSLKELLLAPEPRFENLVSPRGRSRRRASVNFD